MTDTIYCDWEKREQDMPNRFVLCHIRSCLAACVMPCSSVVEELSPWRAAARLAPPKQQRLEGLSAA
jgi:hypothetical protein